MIDSTINGDKTITGDGASVILTGWYCGLVVHHDLLSKSIGIGEIRYESY